MTSLTWKIKIHMVKVNIAVLIVVVITDDWYEYIRSRKNDHMKIDIAELISEFLNDKRTKYKGSYKKFVI